MANSRIIINVTGKVKISNDLIVVDPVVSVTNTDDDYIATSVTITSRFTSATQNYEISRQTGSFNYALKWNDTDVRTRLQNWIDSHMVI